MASDVGELKIKVQYDTKSLDSSEKEVEAKTNSMGEKLSGVGEKAGIKLAAAGTAAVAAVGKLTSSAVQAYADYEQLTGGVETLFKGSSSIVMDYAADAYKTAGVSANQYMEITTSFSASLLQGLGGDTAKAAEIANMAMVDMSDNANKMGTDFDSIQDAYQGFAKQNYTMLDNLKLGYGGTASEMARLINDSGVLGDSMKVTANTVNNVSFDKMVEAIHKVQENMDITGTTALEASTTISGSLNSMKAAWENMLTGVADDSQDFDKLIDNLVTSATTFGANVLPRIEIALDGIVKLVNELAPKILSALPGIAGKLLPGLIKTATNLVVSLAKMLPELVKILVQTVIDTLPELMNSIAEALPDIITGVVDAIMVIAELISNPENIQKMVQGFINLMMALVQNMPRITMALVNALPVIIDGILNFLLDPNNILMMVGAAFQLFMGMVTGAFQILGTLLGTVGSIIGSVIGHIGSFIGEIIGKAVEIGSGFVGKIIEFFSQLPTRIGEFLSSAIGRVQEFVGSFASKALEAGKQFFDNIVNKVKEIPGEMLNIGKNIVEGIWNGISGAGDWIKNKIGEFANGVMDAAKNFFGIHSPSTLFRDEVGVYLAEGIGVGFEKEIGDVGKVMQNAMDEALLTDSQTSISADINSYTTGQIGLWDTIERGIFVNPTEDEAENNGERPNSFTQNNYISRDFTEQQMEAMMEQAIRRATV